MICRMEFLRRCYRGQDGPRATGGQKSRRRSDLPAAMVRARFRRCKGLDRGRGARGVSWGSGGAIAGSWRLGVWWSGGSVVAQSFCPGEEEREAWLGFGRGWRGGWGGREDPGWRLKVGARDFRCVCSGFGNQRGSRRGRLRAGKMDRAAALRDPGLDVHLLEGGRARGGWLVGPAGPGRSTGQRVL